MDTILIKELLKAEVEEVKIKRAAFKTFSLKVPFIAILNKIEESVLKEFSAKIEKLGAETELPLAFAKLKRAILECKKWLEFNRIAYERARPDSPLDEMTEAHFQKLLLKLNGFSEQADQFLPQALSLCHTYPPPDLLANALKASDKITPYLAKKLACIADDPSMNEKILRGFLEQKRQYLTQICSYAAQHLFSWRKLSLEEGRGLFIHVPSLCPFPLIYSPRGTLYLILDITGLMLGKGTGKISTQCIDLMKGDVYALLKPRIVSVEEQEEEEKQKIIKWNFRSTWKESEFLISLQGCEGVLQLQDRFAFERNDQLHLYLIEHLYPDGNLFTQFTEQLINQTKPLFTLSQKLHLAHCMLSGLKNIHEKHIVHGDIKADNVLLSLGQVPETAVIADFNGSYLENDFKEKLNTLALAQWCAPELADIFLHKEMPIEKLLSRLSQATDVWSMGLILYILFYDQFFPWWDLAEDEQIYQHLLQLKEDWLPLHPGVEFIAPLLRAMLAPEPKNRCTSATALALFEPLYKKMSPDALS